MVSQTGQRSLSQKQRDFAREYLIDFNGTQAAIRAGYAEGHADLAAVRNLANEQVREIIDAEREALAERQRVQADDVLNELKLIGYANIRDFLAVNDKGELEIDLANAPREAFRAVAAIKQRVRVSKSGDRHIDTDIRLESKTKALEMLARHTGVIGDKDDGQAAVQVNIVTYGERPAEVQVNGG